MAVAYKTPDAPEIRDHGPPTQGGWGLTPNSEAPTLPPPHGPPAPCFTSTS